jgi:uncharacterized membrane protein
MSTETRLVQVESELADVTARLRRLETEMEAGEVEEPTPPPLNWSQGRPRPARAGIDAGTFVEPGAGPSARAEGDAEAFLPPRFPTDGSSDAPERPASPDPLTVLDLEAVFGGRVLAWIGGLAILVGAALFLGMAISRGWLDQETRTIIAAVLSLLGLAGGVWLHERQGRTEAARALVAASIAGLYGTIVVAVQAYSLISPALGLTCAAAVAAAGFAIAVRWQASAVAAIGSLGALAMPLAVGGGFAGSEIALVAIALAATVAILVWQRWDWLALGAFVVSAPQLVLWTGFDGREHLVVTVAVLTGFWLLYSTAALGYELRKRDEEALPLASWLLLFGGSVTFVGLGFPTLHATGHHTAAVILLFGFAAVQVTLGLLAIRLRIHRELGSLLIGIGIALTAFGLGETFHGPALVVAWAAAGVTLAWLGTRLDATPDPTLSSAERMLLAATAFLALAVGHTLIVEAPPKAIFDGVENLGAAAVAIGACAAAILAGAAFARRISPEGARVGGFLGAAALVYLGSILIVDTVGVYGLGETRQAGQAWLSAFWTVTGLAAVVFGLLRRKADVRLAGLALLGVAIAKVWTYDLSELDELTRVLSFVGLGLLLLVGAFAYQRIKPEA